MYPYPHRNKLKHYYRQDSRPPVRDSNPEHPEYEPDKYFLSFVSAVEASSKSVVSARACGGEALPLHSTHL